MRNWRGTEGVNTVSFNPSGELLVSGSDDQDIVVWKWGSKNRVLSYDSGHEDNVFQARMMPYSDDRIIVSCAADGQVW
jgi:WD repeat-containing protein 42A